jgi:hypothetical protein
VKRSLSNRIPDFMARAAFGGENGWVRNKWLSFLAIAFGILAIFADSKLAGCCLIGLILAVFVADVRRYNREHGDV